MKVILTDQFTYSPDGSEVIVCQKGDTLEGEPAKWALAQDKAKRAPSKKKDTLQNKAK